MSRIRILFYTRDYEFIFSPKTMPGSRAAEELSSRLRRFRNILLGALATPWHGVFNSKPLLLLNVDPGSMLHGRGATFIFFDILLLLNMGA